MKNILLDMREFKFYGDTIDVGLDNNGVIYNILKCFQDEISVDYYSEEIEKTHKREEKYDNGALFFSLSHITSKKEREDILCEIWESLKFGGQIHIWDRIKKQKEIVRDKITVLMPKNKRKEILYSSINPFIDFNEENLQKTIEKYFEIQETKICDKIIYIKATKRGILKDENFINSGEFQVYTQ